MKYLITTIAALVLVGCGESQPTTKAPDTRLHKAAWDGNINDVKQYLTAGMDVDAKRDNGTTPLDAAIYNYKVLPDDDRFKDIIPLLRKHGGKTGEELKAESK